MGGFVKLDTGIVRSSLWIERDVRSVFLTALVMAEPWELEHPEPQLNVRNLQPTGWTVPPGRYGLVRAAGSGILRTDGIPDLEVGYCALIVLGNPDPESRSRDYDGRRVARIDGGYVVLNYYKFRDHDYGAAARMRTMRERRRKEVETPIPVTRNGRNVRHAVTNVTQAEAEAYADTENSLTTLRGGTFADAWRAYPRRAGGNSMADARKAWDARLKEGVSATAMLDGTRRYADYIRATDREGTEYVKQGKTFYGPGEHWTEKWDVPTKKTPGQRLIELGDS